MNRYHIKFDKMAIPMINGGKLIQNAPFQLIFSHSSKLKFISCTKFK